MNLNAISYLMLDRQALSKLIQYIAFEVQDRDIPILRTRLVKLLYLVELEYYRTQRSRLSDLRWIRYRYGPFSFELSSVTSRVGFDLQEEEVDFSSGEGIRYQVHEPHNIDKLLTFNVKSLADRIVARWADEDLGTLLDYVYLETEPMLVASFGEELNFSTVLHERRRSFLDDIELSESEINEIRELQKEYHALTGGDRVLGFDPELAKALESLEGDKNTQALRGNVEYSGKESELGWKGRE